MALENSLARERVLAEPAWGSPDIPAIEAKNESLSLEHALEQTEDKLKLIRRFIKTAQRSLPSEAAEALDITIQTWRRGIAASQTMSLETRSHILLILGMSLSIRKILRRELDARASIEDMVQAIEAFVECLLISDRDKTDEISARFRRLIRELDALLDEPYDGELFEPIIGPLRTLRIALPELELSRRWLVVLSNIHIARYLDSDLEATDSLDEALTGIRRWQAKFLDDNIQVDWYDDLVRRHAEKFLATENVEIVDRLIEIFTWCRIAPEQILEDKTLAIALGQVFVKLCQHFHTRNDDFRYVHRAVRIWDEFKNYSAIKNPYMPAWLWCSLSEASGTLSDADRAFRLMELAMKEHPPTVECLPDSSCPCVKTVLAVQRLKYSHTKDAAALDECIATAEIFLADAMDNAKSQSYIESQLADLLYERGKLKMENSDRKGAEEDLHQAMIMAEAQPGEKPMEFEIATDIANICEALFNLTNEWSYVDKAVVHLLADCDLFQSRHDPQFPATCFRAGDLLLQRNRAFNNEADRIKALELLKFGSEYASGNLEARIFCAEAAAEVREKESRWEEASSLYRLTIELIRSFELQHMKNVDKQRKLSQFGLVATSGAAALLNAGGSAVEALSLLESGRDLLAGSLRELRGDISHLQDAYPDLAEELIMLRDVIDVPPDERATVTSTIIENTTEMPELHVIDRQFAVQQFRKLIHEIRKLPKFTEFLATTVVTVEEMMSAARHGPIVVLNCSQSRCDALLVTVDTVSNLRLSIKGTDVRRKVRHLRASGVSFELLEWLWHTVVSPVLEELGYDKAPVDGRYPRVWWIPTGHFSLLPIHAAGVHTGGSSNTAIDRVMSSYATSLKSLLDGRQRLRTSQKPGSSTDIRHAALVSMCTTPGLGIHSDLPFAEKEIEEVKGLMVSFNIEVAEPPPYRDKVLHALGRSQILHFAGHGSPDAKELSASSILLKDWETNPLTTEDIRSMSLTYSPRFLAYLSACSTGPNNNADTLLTDENIHLISSFRLAGFRHVVGTLWDVQDEYCVDVARIFYETLRDEGISDDAVCLGLHRATLALRNRTISTVVKANSSLTKLSVKTENSTTVYASQTAIETSTNLVGVNETSAAPNVRTAKLVSRLVKQENKLHPRYWAPYVHFGL
ncbi:unnamed protein product [Alternaria alternata]